MFTTNRKTYEEFSTELKNFHSSHKTPFHREPYLMGRKMDLLKLYNTVMSRGGFKKVTDEKAWPLIVEDLGLGRRCVNSSLAVKQLYQRYLEPYERYHAHDEDGWPGGNTTASGGGDNDMEYDSEVTAGGRLRCGRYAPAPSECAVPMVYNENAHMIPPHMRQKWGLSTQLVELKEYSLLEKSLHSGLPNEVDFSLNTTLLMSSQPSGLNLTMNRGLVDLLLAHVGVFDEGFGSYLPVEPYWRQQDDRNMLRYWYENILETEARIFLLPSVFSQSSACKSEESLLEKIESARRQLPLPVIYDLFNLRDDLTLPDTEGHRVFVVATALRNLALEEKCARVLASHPQVLRFALLCGHARHAALRQLGQEMLALLRFPIKGPLCRYFSRILCQCVSHIDRTTRLRGLEMIARQCQLSDNRQFLSNELPMEVYDAIISNLLVKDLHLVVNALEATYMLSTIGTDACERLISNEHCIPLLLSLLTIEAQAMGTDGLIRVKIMQGPTQPPVVAQGTPVTVGQHGFHGHPGSNVNMRLMPGQTLMPPPNSVPRSTTAVVTTGGISLQQATRQGVNNGISRYHGRSASPQVIQQQQTNSSQSSYVPIAPKPILSAQSVLSSLRTLQPSSNHSLQSASSQQCNSKQNQSATSTVNMPQSNQVSSQSSSRKGSTQGGTNTIRGSYTSVPEHPPHPHIVMHQYDHDPEAPTDRREFTLYWLRKYFEPYPQASVSRVHIYTEFQRAYSKQFQQLTNVTALEFHSCVKQAFPNVGQVKVQVPAGNVEIHYNHIKHIDDHPPAIQIPISVTSTGTNIALSPIVNKNGNNATKSSGQEQQVYGYIGPQLKQITSNHIVNPQNHQSFSSKLTPSKPLENSFQCTAHRNNTTLVQPLEPNCEQKHQEVNVQSEKEHCHHEHLHSVLAQTQTLQSSQLVSVNAQNEKLIPVVAQESINQAKPVNCQQTAGNRVDSENTLKDQHQQVLIRQSTVECDSNSNGTHPEATKDSDGACSSPLHSCKLQESRKRSQPSPPVAPTSPISSPAPKRSRPNSVTSCTASTTGSHVTDDSTDINSTGHPRILIAGVPEPLVKEKDCNNYYDRDTSEPMANGDSQGASVLSDTPATSVDSLVDEKSNGPSTVLNGDEAVIRRVLNDTSSVMKSEKESHADAKMETNTAAIHASTRHNRLVNGELSSNHVNGLVKGTLPIVAALKSEPTVLVAHPSTISKADIDGSNANTSSINTNFQDTRENVSKINAVSEDSEKGNISVSLLMPVASVKETNVTKSEISRQLTSTTSDNALVTGTASSNTSLSVVKTVNVPPQAVLVASSSHCNHGSPVVNPPVSEVSAVNSCQGRHAIPSTSLITTSAVLHQQSQKQTCPHSQVHHHITHQHSCGHQPNHVNLNQQTHHCAHHAHVHQHHQNNLQHQHQHQHRHQNQFPHQNKHTQLSKTNETSHQHQHHVCCHHNVQQQQQGQSKSSGNEGDMTHGVNGIVRIPVGLTSSEIVGSSMDIVTSSPSVSSPVHLPRSSTPPTSHNCTAGSPLSSKPARSVAKSRRAPSRKLPVQTLCVPANSSVPTGPASSTSQQYPQSVGVNSTTTTSATIASGHLCEWESCDQVFDTCTLLQRHVFSTHVPVAAPHDHPSNRRYECLWANCDRVPRGLYSLQGHVQDMHLSPSAQQQAQLRRQSNYLPISRGSLSSVARTVATATPVTPAVISNSTEISNRCLQPTNGLSLYPNDAAMQAIRRHAIVPDLLASDNVHSLGNVSSINAPTFTGVATTWPPNTTLREGPVTKHIRLTAALTLRNFVTYSDKAKELLRQEESHLAELALSSMESSKTICQFLYLLNAKET